MAVISGEKALQAFREQWTGPRMLQLIREHRGRLRLDWPIGVGKSHSIDETSEAAVRSDAYDLVVALFPTRQVIDERRWIKCPPADVKTANLKPRPWRRCGTERDRQWRGFERSKLGMLGRSQICGSCPDKESCSWPTQFSKEGLAGAQVIYGTQAHLTRAPAFVLQLSTWAGAKRVLVLLDEVNFIMSCFRRTIDLEELDRFVQVLKEVGSNEDWIFRADLLLRAPTTDLRYPDWRMPPINPDWCLEVQRCGWNKFGEQFKFLAYDLTQFGCSPFDSRERDAAGNLLFAAPPYLNCDFVIYSGTAHPEFSRFRLGQDFASPFEGYRFEHPQTRWYNISSRLGTKLSFPKNSSQVLDFFALLVAQRLQEGRRPLLVTRKCFLEVCAEGMKTRLRELGIQPQIVINGPGHLEANSIPLISYGTVGTNLYEGYDCAYCLCGFYVNERVVNEVLQDVLASDGHIPIQIRFEGMPRRRRAGVLHTRSRVYDVHELAQLALNQQEMDVVLQAVGRVRPYTRPREVITFQCAEHPQLSYTEEFNDLKGARQYFQFPDRRMRRKNKTRQQIQAAKRSGLSQSETADRIGLSIRTTKRYWNLEG